MKVKRLIKSFIYLFPFMILIVNALGMIIPPVRINTLTDLTRPTGTDIEDFRAIYSSQRSLDFDSFINPIVNAYGFLNEDDTPLLTDYYLLLTSIGFTQDDTGMAVEFFARLLTYETYAIILCAIIDVIFLIPEFYNKLEDKYIRGGKKRE